MFGEIENSRFLVFLPKHTSIYLFMCVVMLLIHLLMNSESVESTSGDFVLRLFRNFACYHFIFSKNK